jgi:hypothetical protein
MRSISPRPRISLEEHTEGTVVHKGEIDPASELSPLPEENTTIVDNRIPLTSDAITVNGSETSSNNDERVPNIGVHVQMPNLPPLPPPPTEPTPLDLTPYPDEAARKLVRREHERSVRAYKQALEDRDAAIKDRKRLEDKLRKLEMNKLSKKQGEDSKATDSIAKRNKHADDIVQSAQAEPSQGTASHERYMKENMPAEHTDASATDSQPPISPVYERSYDITSTTSLNREMSRATEVSTTATREPKKQKDRKFCVLPKMINGERDPLWVRVFMEGYDEVSAHTSLFIMGETYERLVGDVGDRIQEWVQDDMTRRMIDDYAS